LKPHLFHFWGPSGGSRGVAEFLGGRFILQAIGFAGDFFLKLFFLGPWPLLGQFFFNFLGGQGVRGSCGDFGWTLYFAGDWLCRRFFFEIIFPGALAAFGPIFFFNFWGGQGGPEEAAEISGGPFPLQAPGCAGVFFELALFKVFAVLLLCRDAARAC